MFPKYSAIVELKLYLALPLGVVLLFVLGVGVTLVEFELLD